MMENRQFLEILKKHLEGSASEEENEFLRTYYNLFELEPEVLEMMAAQEKLAIEQRIEANLMEAVGTKVNKTIRLWPRIVAVAAAVAVIVFGVYFFTYRNEVASVHRNDVVYHNDIAPGKNGATITLANGKVIPLSGSKKGVVIGNGKIAYSVHDEIASIPRNDGLGGALTASTAKGQTYEFTLPDGTHVFLNAESKISFPSQFNGKERRIQLSGEAYFKVVHNAKQPFRVESKGQVVEDIGTEFNINAYADEVSVKTTLVEGSASVGLLSVPVGERSVILTPNQQSVVNGGAIKVLPANMEESLAWKNGLFAFNKETLPSIMRRVARWYNVEVVYESDFISQPFTGSVSRFENISSLLKVLELTGTVHFKIDGRRITVMK